MARRSGPVAVLAAAALLLAGCTGDGADDGSDTLIRPPLGAPSPPPDGEADGEADGGAGAEADGEAAAVDHDVTVPADGRAESILDVLSGVSTVVVRSGAGRDLARASTPAGSRVAPVVDAGGGAVRISLVDGAGTGPAALSVLLGDGVRWRVRLSGGVRDATLDLRGVRLAGIDLTGGISRVEATLPRPTGVVPVRMSGGAGQLLLHLPPGIPAGLRVSGGAGSVVLDGVRRTGLAAGTTVSTATAADRYEVDTVAGVSSVVLDRR